MSYRINKLAIILTQKIEMDLYLLCGQITKMQPEEFRLAPNFYHIRESICKTLEEYMGEMGASYRSDAEMMQDMPPKMRADYVEHHIEKIGASVAKKLIQSDGYVFKEEYGDEFSPFRTFNFEMIFVKAAKLENSI